MTSRPPSGKPAEAAEHDLAESLRRHLFDLSPAATIVHRDGIVVLINPAGCRILGAASADDAIGRPLSLLVTDDEMHLIRAHGPDPAEAPGPAKNLNVHLRCLDGRRIIAMTQTRVLPAGNRPAEITFLLDVTDKLRAEEKLRESEARFSSIFKHSPQLLAIAEKGTGLFLEVNDAFVTDSGYSREEMIGRTSVELNLWVDPEERRQMLALLAKDGVVCGFDALLRRKDGSIHNGLFSAVVIKVAGEELLLTMVIDITARKQAEKASQEHAAELAAMNAELRLANEKLRDLDRQKREFLSSISHELRTPVATTQAAVENMLRGMAGDLADQQRHLLTIVGRNGERLGRLIDNLLDLSRLDDRNLTIRLARIDLRMPIERAVEAFQPIVERAGLSLEWRPPSDPVYAHADQDKIIQIVSNLVDNARRFARRWIAASLEQSADGRAVIRMRDDGPGVADEDLPLLFQRFCRIGKDDGKGHIGLGLSVVRALAEAHGGRAFAENGADGTSFVVVLPVGGERKPPPI